MVTRNIARFQIPQLLAAVILYKLGCVDDNDSLHSSVHRVVEKQSEDRFVINLVHVEVGYFSSLDGLGVELYNHAFILDDSVPFLNSRN